MLLKLNKKWMDTTIDSDCEELYVNYFLRQAQIHCKERTKIWRVQVCRILNFIWARIKEGYKKTWYRSTAEPELGNSQKDMSSVCCDEKELRISVLYSFSPMIQIIKHVYFIFIKSLILSWRSRELIHPHITYSLLTFHRCMKSSWIYSYHHSERR